MEAKVCAEDSTTRWPSLESTVLRMVGDEVLGVEDLALDADFFEIGLDSMAIMQLILLLEERYGIELPVEQVSRENFSNARAISALLIERGWRPESAEEKPDVDTPPTVVQRTTTPESAPTNTGTDDRLPSDPDATFEHLLLCEGDHFPMAFDHSLRTDGQPGHVAHTFVELGGTPDVARLKGVLAALATRFPLLTARVVRRGFGLPRWSPASEPVRLELRTFSHVDGPRALAGPENVLFEHLDDLLHSIVNSRLARGDSFWENVRFHLVERQDGSCLLVCSWSHIMMDGVGAELFLTEFARLVRGEPARIPPYAGPSSDPRGYYARWRAAQPMLDRLVELREQGLDCLPPRDLLQGPLAFEVYTLTAPQTSEAVRRATSICGPLVRMPFHLACAMRAHAAAFAAQGRLPGRLMSNVPVQTRTKGTTGPLFQNHLTMFFGSLAAEQLESWETATRALLDQHSTFVRDRLGERFRDMMWMMRPMPPGLHLRFVKWQMQGLFCSFFHSHTGEFAPELQEIGGAEVLNGWHVPGIASPPGTGIFGSERNGRLTLTFCENCGAIGERERLAMLERLFDDYCGEAPPTPALRGTTRSRPEIGIS